MGNKLNKVLILEDGFVRITTKDMAEAMAYKNGCTTDESMPSAKVVMNHLGDHYFRFVDNKLVPEERQIFYHFLEDTGLAYAERIVEKLEKGRLFELHYWNLNVPEIFKARKAYKKNLNSKKPVAATLSEEENLQEFYNNLPPKCFRREIIDF